MLRRVVIVVGVLLAAFGVVLLGRAHTQVGVCSVSHSSTASGLNSSCVRTLMGYSEGFVFVASGFLIIVIALTMISRRERLDLKSELRAVPRTWKKADYVITSEPDALQSATVAPRTVLSGPH
jgi:hypothetical protein